MAIDIIDVKRFSLPWPKLSGPNCAFAQTTDDKRLPFGHVVRFLIHAQIARCAIVKDAMLRTIQLEQETVQALEASAEAMGMSLADYLRSIAVNGGGTQMPLSASGAGVAEFDSILDEFFVQNPRKLPSLPNTFSRADIYVDHD